MPYAGLFLICAGYFKIEELPGSRALLSPTFASLLLGFVIGFFFEACIGMLGFWFLEVTSLLWVISTLNYFVSGQMFPLDLLPPAGRGPPQGPAVPVSRLFPGSRLPGKGGGADWFEGLLIELAWAVALLVLLTRWLYARGLRRYSTFGG